MNQNKVIKLTNTGGEPILIGVESIISVKESTAQSSTGKRFIRTVIQSRAAMVDTFLVEESVEEVWNLINGK
jgi:hypothetical protein